MWKELLFAVVEVSMAFSTIALATMEMSLLLLVSLQSAAGASKVVSSTSWTSGEGR